MSLRAALVAILLSGCGDVERELQLVRALPECVPPNINSVQLTTLGDFPPAATRTTATDSAGKASLALPDGTRVLQIDGLGPGGLLAFGRTPPFELNQLSPRVALNYGPPDTLCATSDMHYARAAHQATLLRSGSVLLSGGHDGDGFPVPKLELYVPFGDEVTGPGSFRVVDPSGTTAIDARASLGHAVAVLPSGDVLITGGAPSAGGEPIGIAYEGYTHHRADGIRIGDAQVLFGGGRAFHSATVLPDGRVVLIGGCARFESSGCAADSVLGTSVIFNQGVWSNGPSLITPRWGHQAFLRGDGQIWVVGGGGPVERLDPAGVSTEVGVLEGVAALLPTGALMAVRGPEAVAWVDGQEVPLSPLAASRTGHTLTILEDGAVLVAGGGASVLDPTLILYHPVSGPRAVTSRFSRREHSATRLTDGSILLAGGGETSGASTEASVFLHSSLGPFSNLPTITFENTDVPVVPRRPDRVRVVGGWLEVAAGSGTELALVGALELGDFQLSLTAGTAGPSGAMVILGWKSDAEYAFVSLTPGQPTTLSTMRKGAVEVICRGETLDAAELPDGSDPAPLMVTWRTRNFEVFTPGRRLLQCAPGDALGRGAVGLGALSGRVLFDNASLTR